MEYFIPKRKDKKEKNIVDIKKKSIEEIFLENNKELIFINKDEVLKEYLENEKFKEVIYEIKRRENKKALNLAQFERFYSFVEEQNFDFFDEKVKEFIEKQSRRDIAIKFYEFIKNEFSNEKQIKEDENEKIKICLEAKQRLEIIKKYLLYVFGEERINEKLKKESQIV